MNKIPALLTACEMYVEYGSRALLKGNEECLLLPCLPFVLLLKVLKRWFDTMNAYWGTWSGTWKPVLLFLILCVKFRANFTVHKLVHICNWTWCCQLQCAFAYTSVFRWNSIRKLHGRTNPSVQWPLIMSFWCGSNRKHSKWLNYQRNGNDGSNGFHATM